LTAPLPPGSPISMIASANELRYFVEIAETRNFSRAAERLGVSQPALSQAVQKLEKSFGRSLFVRTRTGVQLTRAGQTLLLRGKRLLVEWDELVLETSRDGAELRGTYRLGCHPSVGLYALPHVLPALMQAHPELCFTLSHDLSRKVTEKVIAFELDFAIVINPVKHPGLVIRKVGTDQVGFWTRATPSPLQDPLSGNAVLLCDPELAQSQELMKRIQKTGARFARTVICSSLEVIASLVSAGTGIGILPQRVAKRIPALELVPASERFPTFADTICLIYRSDTHSSHAAKTLARSLAEKLQGV
jgi:LysR family transcriptional regulator, cell division regulator